MPGTRTTSPQPIARVRHVSDAAVITVAGIVRLAAGAWLGFRPFDDTFITFRYALNLASGEGFVYNAGSPILGTTTPLWTMVLAGMSRAGVPLESGSLLLSLVLDALTALLIFRLLGHLGFARAVRVAAPLLFLASFDYLSLSRSGMETSCFVFVIMAALEAAAARNFGRAGLCCGLACVTRPEGLILVPVLAIALSRNWGTLTPATRLTAVLLPGAIAGGWAVFAIATFGSVVPQSVLAKAAASGGSDLARFSWANLALFFLKGQYGGEIFARTWLQLSWAVTMLAALAAVDLVTSAVRGRSGAFDRLLLLLAFPLCYLVGLALAHAFTFFPWYYAPVYPFAAVLAMAGAARLSARPAVAIGVCAVLIAGQIGAALAVKIPAARTFWVDGYRQVAAVVPRDPAVTVAALEIGAVGWRTWPSHIIDLEGLVTPSAVGIPPHEHVKTTLPDFIVVRTDNAAEFLAAVEREPWFARSYELVAVAPDPVVPREFRTYRRLSSKPPLTEASGPAGD